jgi:hypothetical protein
MLLIGIVLNMRAGRLDFYAKIHFEQDPTQLTTM